MQDCSCLAILSLFSAWPWSLTWVTRRRHWEPSDLYAHFYASSSAWSGVSRALEGAGSVIFCMGSGVSLAFERRWHREPSDFYRYFSCITRRWQPPICTVIRYREGNGRISGSSAGILEARFLRLSEKRLEIPYV